MRADSAACVAAASLSLAAAASAIASDRAFNISSAFVAEDSLKVASSALSCATSEDLSVRSALSCATSEDLALSCATSEDLSVEIPLI